MAEIKVGDRVEIVSLWGFSNHRVRQDRTGVVGEIHNGDGTATYRVMNTRGEFMTWATEVRPITDNSTASDREHHVIRMARFLAGEGD
ncbi:hypothetical protein ACWDX6_23890 [Streptomyces sp. NPDC003027]